jgi:hypothetical protein
VATGNGAVDPGRNLWGQSVLKLRFTGDALAVTDYYTPFDWVRLNALDRDLGSSGLLLVPGTSHMVLGSKDGKIRVLDRKSLGKRVDGDAQLPSSTLIAGDQHIHGAPVHWRTDAGDFVYVMPERDRLRQYRLDGGRLVDYRLSEVESPRTVGENMPGGILSLSANGGRDGVLWVSINIIKDAQHAVVPGLLRAFDASDVTKELWNSERESSRDSYGNLAKFNPPTIYRGRVYVPTFSNRYCVYGKLP